MNIESLAWTAPRILETKAGPKQIREANVSGDDFWQEWKQGDLKAQGYSVSKWDGQWKLTEWRQPDGSMTATAKAKAQEVKQTRDLEAHDANYEPELPASLAMRFAHVRSKITEEYEYQIPHIKRLAVTMHAYGSALDASDTGTGKTLCAFAAAATLGLKVFVLTPKAVIPTWRNAARFYDVELVEAVNYEAMRTGKTGYGVWRDDDKRNFVWNRQELDPEQVVLVLDECHVLKAFDTQNCAMGVAALEQGYHVLALSATAADNPLQMKFAALLTGLIRNGREFWGWALDHGVKRTRFGHAFRGGHEVLSKIHRQIFPARGSRIRIADLGDKFPESKIIAEAYAMNGAAADIRKVYSEMADEIAKLEASSAKDKGASILTAQLRGRQRAELLKVPTLCQMAEDGIAEGMSVCIILNFEDSLVALASRLRTNNIIRGGQDPENREAIRAAFDEDKEDLIVMNIRAGGVGISLHGSRSSRPRLVLISPTYSGQDLKQALGRCWRAGGARSVQKIIFASLTCEEEACELVRAKIGRIDQLNDGQLDALLRF